MIDLPLSARLRHALAALLFALALPGPHVLARDGASPAPQPPCNADETRPAFAETGPFPSIEVWFKGDLPDDWVPPACVGWQSQPMDVLIATAGRFEEPGGVDAVVARMAKISGLPAMQYWSATRQIWRPLVNEAFALSGPNDTQRRADFSSEEFQPGRTLYFWQDENTPAGSLVYRLQVRERGPDRLVLALENTEAVSFMLLPLFEPGEYQSLVHVRREQGSLWRYYSLQRGANRVSLSTRDHRSSYINRAAALFRFLAGLPTDTDPPLAPR